MVTCQCPRTTPLGMFPAPLLQQRKEFDVRKRTSLLVALSRKPAKDFWVTLYEHGKVVRQVQSYQTS
ncbi:hypothetical protein Y032_0090g2407 [Ancylostoma ceylanicum]|uniref:Uncharacterized protein n=1 Tax=Ancylostoma ceylanicum TaxID=53326 RepID=A0A016TMA0_9BILA|nr:hypothetical protein Y032_0090g2407 [Ancylostoma ceylanicum]